MILRKDNGELVALVPHNIPRNEYEANARLIASAPDMAIEIARLSSVNADMLAALESIANTSPGDFCRAKARAAIAKAKATAP